ncbi:hypothetical protein GTY83_07220 [Streptomyces sp. SID4928]|uniref:hypothetical protein n=1 Tax=unclassified Streptomyces TaxID=2593676 RepID=UPI0001C1C980|nr:hypothetical protein [Streptomyces sp. ACT-1]EGE40829.1 hypothetical protein SACT1_1464 [Streptomyces sp. ACT-1]MYR48896.1 hypothetical protein [Streptomyces sp. SID4928]
MPDTTPDRPADQLRAAAERARATGDPLHTVVADLLDRHAKEYDASVAAAANVWPDSAEEAARWLAAQVPPEALAVARQLLGTSTGEPESGCAHCGSHDHSWDDCAAYTALVRDDAAAPPAPAGRAATRDRIRRAICEASGFDWLPDELMEPDEYGEHADAVLAVLGAPADRAAEAKAATTITRLRAERAELNRRLDCLRGDMRDMEHCLREQNAEFDRTRRAAAEPQPARRRLTPSEHDRAWHAIEGGVGEDGADPGTVLNAVLHALRIDAPTAAEEQAASPRRRLAGEAAAGAHQTTEGEARPAEHSWAAELHDPLANEWVPGTRYAVRDRAVNALAHGRKVAPLWKDGTPTERRLVRATTTYTVEPTPAVPAAAEETTR